jgi:TRAP-type C4-dicarboxylate transport system permease small subunit
MKMTDAVWFVKFRKSTNSSSSWLERVGLAGMAAMALTELIDVIGSKVFEMPLPGSTETTAALQVVAIAGGLAYSKIDDRHIRVDFLLDFLPERGKAVLDVFSSILGLGFLAVAAWMSYEHGLNLFESGTRTLLLGIPLSPLAFWIALCCLPMCCVIITELLTSIERMLK